MGDDTLTISVDLPAGTLDRVKRRAKELQFHDIQFYLRWLIAKDALPESPDADLIMALVHEGDMSGPGRIVDDAFRRELIERTDRLIAEAANKRKRAVG